MFINLVTEIIDISLARFVDQHVKVITHVYIYIYIYTCIYLCTFVYISPIYVYMCIYIYIYRSSLFYLPKMLTARFDTKGFFILNLGPDGQMMTLVTSLYYMAQTIIIHSYETNLTGGSRVVYFSAFMIGSCSPLRSPKIHSPKELSIFH